MNTRKINVLSLAGICTILISCGSYKNIYTNRDESVDFSNYHTFAWAPDSTSNRDDKPELAAFDNDIVRNNAKNYINHNLTNRGLLLDIKSPDLVLKLVLLNEKQEKVVTYQSYPGYYYYSPFYFPYYYPYYRTYTWYGAYPFWNDVTTYTKTYIKGTITIDVFDRKLQKLIWTGSAEGDIYDPSYIKYAVHPAVDRILKRFPIKTTHKSKRLEDVNDRPPVVRMNPPRSFQAGESSGDRNRSMIIK